MAQSQVAEDIGAGAAGFMATDIAVVSAVGLSKKLESKVVDDGLLLMKLTLMDMAEAGEEADGEMVEETD